MMLADASQGTNWSLVIAIVGIVLGLMQVVIAGLLRALWRMYAEKFQTLVADLKCTRDQLTGFRDAFVTPELCQERHEGQARLMARELEVVNRKLDQLCNGGGIQGIQVILGQHETRLDHLEDVIKNLR